MKAAILALVILALAGTESCSQLEKYGRCYQKDRSEACLQKVVDLMPLGVDTAYVREILGEPIDFGFDFRYLVDVDEEPAVNPDLPFPCPRGAVFHIDEQGKIDDKWLGDICE
ncbi:MAG: hypothetical protein KDC44_03185 [Phaeodactylibacter sp.]|nr:hypothetical protein [Phaeodactylibacter sp.]